jgi:uncharacterized protein
VRDALVTGSTVTNDKGTTRDLTAEDTLIVPHYNLAVSTISHRTADGVGVGAVDRFQGKQAPVVRYAMTCSSDDDLPRGIDFPIHEEPA